MKSVKAKPTTIRLNKYISECGIASRRNAEEYIKEGRITVNGKRIESLSVRIHPYEDIITLDGKKINRKRKIYFLLNKQKGYITSTKDEKNRKTVVDLIKTNDKIFPIGRLDYNTTGVLLLTNDGDFANFVLHPSNEIPREYIANLNNPLDEKDRQKLRVGIILDGRNSRFTDVEILSQKNFKKVRVVTGEGRNHFVKRMFQSLGYRVVELERKSF